MKLKLFGEDSKNQYMLKNKKIQRNTLNKAPGWVHAYTWSIFGVLFLVLLVLFILYRDTDIWYLWFGNQPKDQHAFAEAITPGIFRTRSNSWSNLAYVLVGIYIVTYAWWDLRRTTTDRDPYAVRQPALMALYGMACIVLGFGSGLMHASMMPFGHKADVFGMFFTFAALIALQWGRWIPYVPFTNRRWPSWPIFGIAAIAVSLLLLAYSKEFGGAETILGWLTRLIVLGIVVDAVWRRTSQQYFWLFLAIISLAVGGYLQRADVARRLNPSDAWLQGHAVWHLLTAAMYAFMAIFYRTEIPRTAYRAYKQAAKREEHSVEGQER